MNKLLVTLFMLAVAILAFATEPEPVSAASTPVQIDISMPTYLIVMNNYNMQQTNYVQYSRSENKNYSYEPDAARHWSAKSLSDYFVSRHQGSDDQLSLFRTLNSVGFKYPPYIGVEAYIKIFQLDMGTAGSVPFDMNQIGIGAGLPDINNVRAYVYAVSNDFSGMSSNSDKKQQYSGVLAQVARRFYGNSQFTEIGAEVESYSYPDNYNPLPLSFTDGYFDRDCFNWAPDSRLNAYLVSSSIKNKYLEPHYLSGISPASSPLALVDEAAYAFIAKVTVQEDQRTYYVLKDTGIQLSLPINFSRFAGIDMNFIHWKQEKENNDDSPYNSANYENKSESLRGAFRLALLGAGPIKLVGTTEYVHRKSDGSQKEERINFTGDLVMHFSSHFALSAYFKHYNEWLLEKGAFETEPLGYVIGSTLALRL
jgi:hypothetical protein